MNADPRSPAKFSRRRAPAGHTGRMAAGDYAIVELLHEGRSSQVFRALRRRDDVRVILKAHRREHGDRGA